VKLAVATCGRCGKPRGLFHTCVTRIGRRPGRTRVRLTATCSKCGKRMGSPLRHVCATKTDFRKRKAKAKRDAATAKRREKRKAAAARKRARVAERRKAAAARRRKGRQAPAKPRHDYQTCREDDCQRQACQAWREGRKEGFGEGYQEGILNCPRWHG
jgi:hypothetical protein